MSTGRAAKHPGERETFLRAATESNKVDLRRLEELVDAGPWASSPALLELLTQ